jgi:hypothetical protein
MSSVRLVGVVVELAALEFIRGLERIEEEWNAKAWTKGHLDRRGVAGVGIAASLVLVPSVEPYLFY